MAARDDAHHVHVEDAASWREWLDAHHDSVGGVWVVTWRTPTGHPQPTYESLVEEALCLGWVDGQKKQLDEERTAQWFTPRTARSAWAATNKARVARLAEEGRLAPAGLAAIERAKENGSWAILDDAEADRVPEDLAIALDAVPGATDAWWAQSRSARKFTLSQLAFARRAATRARRVAEAVAALGTPQPQEPS